MKTTKPFLALAAAGCLFAGAPGQAAITINDPGFDTVAYYTFAGSGNIVSYDWAATGRLYYMVQTPSFAFGGLYEVAAGVTSPVVAGNTDFSGASVVALGDYVYFNTSDFSDQKIYKYGPVSGTASSSLASTTANYGVYAHDGKLFITGAQGGFGASHLYETGVDASGNLASNPATDIGTGGSGSSGPLTFDSAGNLYYAPGYNDHSIYKWSASQVANALADPAGSALSVAGQLWVNYDSLYGAVSGATSLLVNDDGSLLVTLTNFSGPSVLAAFGIDGTGSYSGTQTTILSDTDLLGELRQYDGEIYLSSGNGILQLVAVPEPATVLSLLVGLGVIVLAGRRNREVRSR